MAYSLTYDYDSTSQSYTVTDYSDITTSDKVVIPSTYDNGTNGEHPVTSIKSYAFANCSSLTSITIPDSVISIGDAAFANCSGLKIAKIGNGLISIGYGVFLHCHGLTSVAIGNSVTSIGTAAFANCSSLTSITIPDSVASIGDSVFIGCSKLKQLILFPSSPPTLGSSAIPSNVQSIYVQQSSKAAYQAATNWNAFVSKIVSDNIYLSFVRFNQKNKEYINEYWNDFNLANGTGDVLIKTTDTNQSFKVMTDGRAKVQSAPVDDNDVVRLLELDKKLDKSSIVQTMGQATDKTMSQKAITYEFLNIPQVVEKVTGKNIFNKNNIKDTGFYIQYTTGNLVASSTYCVTDYDFIKESTNYYVQNTGGGFQVCFYDKLKNYISGAIINSGYGTFTTPSDCVYYRCSVMINKLDIVMIAEGTTTSTYEEYKFFGYILKNSALFRNVKIVTKTGEYGYRTVSAAVADSVDGDIIFVKNGTYDDEIILARDKEITIIGENKNKVIIQNITNSYQTPPLEMSKGKIKNLTLYAKDTGNESTHSSGWLAYGMHIDFDGLIDNTLIVENCVIKSDKNYAVGIGLRKGGVLSFENCAFESRDSSAIFFHDNANSNNAGIQTLSIKNCVAVSSGTSGTVMRVDSQCIEGTTVNVTFINNVFISNTVETAVINTINQSTGTATTVGNFKGLINFYKTKLCYGNNLSDLNY